MTIAQKNAKENFILLFSHAVSWFYSGVYLEYVRDSLQYPNSDALTLRKPAGSMRIFSGFKSR
jgi:hypothetical protein